MGTKFGCLPNLVPSNFGCLPNLDVFLNIFIAKRARNELLATRPRQKHRACADHVSVTPARNQIPDVRNVWGRRHKQSPTWSPDCIWYILPHVAVPFSRKLFYRHLSFCPAVVAFLRAKVISRLVLQVSLWVTTRKPRVTQNNFLHPCVVAPRKSHSKNICTICTGDLHYKSTNHA